MKTEEWMANYLMKLENLSYLVENCADEPEIKGVTCQGEDIPDHDNDKLIMM